MQSVCAEKDVSLDHIQPTTKFLLGKIRKGTRVYVGVIPLLKGLLFCYSRTENFHLGKNDFLTSHNIDFIDM